jgi:hypothetical protein
MSSALLAVGAVEDRSFAKLGAEGQGRPAVDGGERDRGVVRAPLADGHDDLIG